MGTTISGATGIDKVQDSSITSAKIADGAITNTDINSSAAIAGSKLVMPSGSLLQVVTSEFSTDTVTTNTSSPVVTQPEVKEPTVMGKMIEKMSKKNVVNVPVEINVNIPTPAIYAMLSEGMESEDLNEEIMSVALAQIEINKLQEYIKEQITNFLIEYYG